MEGETPDAYRQFSKAPWRGGSDFSLREKDIQRPLVPVPKIKRDTEFLSSLLKEG